MSPLHSYFSHSLPFSQVLDYGIYGIEEPLENAPPLPADEAADATRAPVAGGTAAIAPAGNAGGAGAAAANAVAGPAAA